jgi:hypothetical protein
MKAADIVAAAQSHIEYALSPSRPGRGARALDCAGVPVHVAKTLGVPLTDYTQYGRLPVPSEMRARRWTPTSSSRAHGADAAG